MRRCQERSKRSWTDVVEACKRSLEFQPAGAGTLRVAAPQRQCLLPWMASGLLAFCRSDHQEQTGHKQNGDVRRAHKWALPALGSVPRSHTDIYPHHSRYRPPTGAVLDDFMPPASAVADQLRHGTTIVANSEPLDWQRQQHGAIGRSWFASRLHTYYMAGLRPAHAVGYLPNLLVFNPPGLPLRLPEPCHLTQQRRVFGPHDPEPTVPTAR
jgi:hypothetical protein